MCKNLLQSLFQCHLTQIKSLERRGLASHPAAPSLIPSVPGISTEKKVIDVTAVNQHHWLDESGLWLENVGRANLVLACGKPNKGSRGKKNSCSD